MTTNNPPDLECGRGGISTNFASHPARDSGDSLLSSSPVSEPIQIGNYLGLEKTAKRMCMDPDFWIFRRFQRLHLFNTLCIQHRLAGLDKSLRKRVWYDEAKGYTVKDISPSDEKAIRKLAREIQCTLKDYDSALSHLKRINSYGEPSKNIAKHLEAWSNVIGQSILSNDLCVEKGTNLNDLASIGVKEKKKWIHRLIDNSRLRNLFESKSSRAFRNDPRNNYPELENLMLYSEVNVRRTERFLMNSTFCLLLLSPIAALLYVHGKALKLTILVIFVLIASMLTSSFPDAADQTSLAVVAGYSAILVVFLSNSIDSP